MPSLNVSSSFSHFFSVLTYFDMKVAWHYSSKSSLESHRVALGQGTEGWPGRLWAAGHVVRPCALPAPSGLG